MVKRWIATFEVIDCFDGVFVRRRKTQTLLVVVKRNQEIILEIIIKGTSLKQSRRFLIKTLCSATLIVHKLSHYSQARKMIETSNGHSSQEETVDFSGKGMKLDTEDAGMYLLL